MQDAGNNFQVFAQRLDDAHGFETGASELYPRPEPQLLSTTDSLQLFTRRGCTSPEAPCATARALYSVSVVDLPPPGSNVSEADGVAAGTWTSHLLNSSAGAAFLEGLRGAIEHASEPDSILNQRSEWLTVVSVPHESGHTSGHQSSAACSDGLCACTMDIPASGEPGMPHAPRVPAVVLNLELRSGSRGIDLQTNARAALMAMMDGLRQLYRLGVDVCIQEPRGAVIASNCPFTEPGPEVADGQWNVSLHRGTCPALAGHSAAEEAQQGDPPGATFRSRAIDFFKSACTEAFEGFPPGWEQSYCGVASAFICAEGAQILRLLLRCEGGSAALKLDGSTIATVEPRRAGHSDAQESPGLTEAQAADAIVTVRGCHRIEVVFEDRSSAGSQNERVR